MPRQEPTKVKKGPEWLRTAFGDRDKYTRAIQPVQGHGIAITERDDGRVINAAGSRRGATTGSDGVGYGWRVELRRKPVAEGVPSNTWQVMVPADAELRLSETPTDIAEVENVGEWADIVSFPATVFLKATFTREGVLESAQIRGNADETFDLDAAPWETDSCLEFDDDEDEKRHKITRRLIAKITRDGDADPVADQKIGTHLTLVKDMILGRPATLLVAP